MWGAARYTTQESPHVTLSTKNGSGILPFSETLEASMAPYNGDIRVF
jgi:hypothetical protein